MKKLFLLLTLVSLFAVSGCNKEDEPVIDNKNKTELPTVDENGNPLGRPIPSCHGGGCFQK